MTPLKNQRLAIEQWWEEYRQLQQSAERLCVNVYVRSLAPAPGTHQRRTQLIDEIRAASDMTSIDSVSLRVVGEKICLCEKCQQQSKTPVREEIDELRKWRTGGIHASGFTTHHVNSTMADEEYRMVVPPELSLGIVADDDLVGVFPCDAEGRTVCPSEFIEEILPEKSMQMPDSSDENQMLSVDN